MFNRVREEMTMMMNMMNMKMNMKRLLARMSVLALVMFAAGAPVLAHAGHEHKIMGTVTMAMAEKGLVSGRVRSN